jgi:hypothetical protein
MASLWRSDIDSASASEAAVITVVGSRQLSYYFRSFLSFSFLLLPEITGLQNCKGKKKSGVQAKMRVHQDSTRTFHYSCCGHTFPFLKVLLVSCKESKESAGDYQKQKQRQPGFICGT